MVHKELIEALIGQTTELARKVDQVRVLVMDVAIDRHRIEMAVRELQAVQEAEGERLSVGARSRLDLVHRVLSEQLR